MLTSKKMNTPKEIKKKSLQTQKLTMMTNMTLRGNLMMMETMKVWCLYKMYSVRCKKKPASQQVGSYKIVNPQ